jgi:hypothetical protein
MFPTAYSTVYRNAEGEVTGWSDESSYEPEPEDDLDDDLDDDVDGEPFDDDADAEDRHIAWMEQVMEDRIFGD